MLAGSCCPMGSLGLGQVSRVATLVPSPLSSRDNSDSPDHFHNRPQGAKIRNHVFSYKLCPVPGPG